MTWFNDQKYLLLLPKTVNRASQDRLWVMLLTLKKYIEVFKIKIFSRIYSSYVCVCNYKEKQKEKLKNIHILMCINLLSIDHLLGNVEGAGDLKTNEHNWSCFWK